MRRDRQDQLDGPVAEDLAALDAALAGTTAADPALALLVADVRAVAPVPAADARARLDRRVAEGFAPAPRPGPGAGGAARRGARRRWRDRLLLPTAGLGLAAVVVALVVAGSARRGADDSASGGASG